MFIKRNGIFFYCIFSIFVDACCKRVVVVSSGAAKEDQSLYLGTYRIIANYNGHAAYELEGADQLYIYFYSSVVSIFLKKCLVFYVGFEVHFLSK